VFRATADRTVLPYTIEGWDLRKEDDREKCVKKWQKNLRLEDFDVVISLKRFVDLNLGDSTASIRVNEWHKCATIYLLDPIDYILSNYADMIWGYDMEDGIVHELLHIPMFPYTPEDKETLEYTALEVCISTMANALLNLDRARCVHKKRNGADIRLKEENDKLKAASKAMLKILKNETNPVS